MSVVNGTKKFEVRDMMKKGVGGVVVGDIVMLQCYDTWLVGEVIGRYVCRSEEELFIRFWWKDLMPDGESEVEVRKQYRKYVHSGIYVVWSLQVLQYRMKGNDVTITKAGLAHNRFDLKHAVDCGYVKL